MIYILIAAILSFITGILGICNKIDFRKSTTLIVIFMSAGMIISFISTLFVGVNVTTFSTEEYLAKNNNILWEQCKKETINCKNIYITEENDIYEVKCKMENNVNKKFYKQKDSVIFCKSNEDLKKIEIYELPYPKLTPKESLFTLAPLFRNLDDGKFIIYKIYNI